MGMYDNINFKIECPRCKKEIQGFQSKDGHCVMETLEFYEVNNFYASCSNCRTWIEFTLKGNRQNRELTIKDYKKEVEKTTKADDIKHQKDMDRLFGRVKA